MKSDREGLTTEQMWEYKKLRVFLHDLQQSLKLRRKEYLAGLKADEEKTLQEIIDDA